METFVSVETATRNHHIINVRTIICISPMDDAHGNKSKILIEGIDYSLFSTEEPLVIHQKIKFEQALNFGGVA